MASDWEELGSVPGAHGTLKAYRQPGGSVLLVDGASNNVVIPRLSLAGMAEILDRAAMPGQVPPVTLTLYGCCEHCEDGDDDKPCGIHHRDTCMLPDCEPGHKAATAVVTAEA